LQLEEQLKYDPLTKLYNMSTFYALLAAAIEKEEFPLSLAVIDVDNFKKVNDTYGHDNGNTVLIYLAQLLQAHCSAMGLVFRYGGEEFAVMFPHKSTEEASLVMKDVQRIFGEHKFEFMQEENITFSCGITTTIRGCIPRNLFNIADQAMYQAKSAGKNRTIAL
ncbi:MAG: diguanylate cyclase, partial [Clostridiales bacterium]|nr:diguanylate cyclase [Clostridiales bacterium]